VKLRRGEDFLVREYLETAPFDTETVDVETVSDVARETMSGAVLAYASQA